MGLVAMTGRDSLEASSRRASRSVRCKFAELFRDDDLPCENDKDAEVVRCLFLALLILVAVKDDG